MAVLFVAQRRDNTCVLRTHPKLYTAALEAHLNSLMISSNHDGK